jgi:hypothetical protein
MNYCVLTVLYVSQTLTLAATCLQEAPVSPQLCPMMEVEPAAVIFTLRQVSHDSLKHECFNNNQKKKKNNTIYVIDSPIRYFVIKNGNLQCIEEAATTMKWTFSNPTIRKLNKAHKVSPLC